jgi:hypothetical protein
MSLWRTNTTPLAAMALSCLHTRRPPRRWSISVCICWMIPASAASRRIHQSRWYTCRSQVDPCRLARKVSDRILRPGLLNHRIQDHMEAVHTEGQRCPQLPPCRSRRRQPHPVIRRHIMQMGACPLRPRRHRPFKFRKKIRQCKPPCPRWTHCGLCSQPCRPIPPRAVVLPLQQRRP